MAAQRLTYVSSAWSGFTTATDRRQRVDAFLSRSKRCGFCLPDLPDFNKLLEEANDQLFERILNNTHPQFNYLQLHIVHLLRTIRIQQLDLDATV